MAEYRVQVKVGGPIVEGRAPEAIREFMDAATLKVAQRGQEMIKAAADAMDRSGRGGTGRAAAGVTLKARTSALALAGGSTERVIFGEMRKGDVWWPWLEGISKRNARTRFKGYHTFRETGRKLEDQAQEIIAPLVDDLTRQLGGG